MSEPEKGLFQSLVERLTPKPTTEERTLDDLAREKLRTEDEQLKRNLEELERLAGGGEPDGP